MEKEFVPYEQALALKELGFDEPCFGFYDESLYFPNNENQYGTFCNQKLDASSCSAPLYQQAFRWFREKYGLFSSILPFQDIEYRVKLCYYYCIINLNKYKDEDIMYSEFSLGASNINFSSPEEAELACLKKLIEIVENEHTNR